MKKKQASKRGPGSGSIHAKNNYTKQYKKLCKTKSDTALKKQIQLPTASVKRIMKSYCKGQIMKSQCVMSMQKITEVFIQDLVLRYFPYLFLSNFRPSCFSSNISKLFFFDGVR